MSFTSVGESETGSVFGAVSSFFASFVPTAYADEEEEEEEAASDDAQEEEGSADEEEEDEDEDDEPEDPRDEIYAACEEKDCAPAKHHFDECQTRVEAGKLLFEGEDCIEEFFHLAHCASECTAPKLFAKLV